MGIRLAITDVFDLISNPESGVKVRIRMTAQKDQVSSTAEPVSQSESSSEAIAMRRASITNLKDYRIEARLLIGLLSLALVYTLVLVQKVLVPIVLAILLSFVLTPVVRWLERLHVPRTLGAGIVVMTLLCMISYGMAKSLDPISTWMERAPQILRQIEHKVYPIKKTVEEVSKTAEQVDRIASVSTRKTVELKGVSLREVLYVNAWALVTGALLVTLLLYFLLSWGQVMLSRISQLFEEQESRRRFMQLSTLLEGEVSKYLSIITLINFGLGVVVTFVLYAFGMPNPLLWGVVAALLNYIPYLGGLVTAVLLCATALLSFEGLAMPLFVVATFTGLTIVEGQIVTPLILGKRLALNPLVVFLSVVFWFWLWGVMGALMAVPMLITFKLIGDRTKVMRSVAIIAER